MDPIHNSKRNEKGEVPNSYFENLNRKKDVIPSQFNKNLKLENTVDPSSKKFGLKISPNKTNSSKNTSLNFGSISSISQMSGENSNSFHKNILYNKRNKLSGVEMSDVNGPFLLNLPTEKKNGDNDPETEDESDNNNKKQYLELKFKLLNNQSISQYNHIIPKKNITQNSQGYLLKEYFEIEKQIKYYVSLLEAYQKRLSLLENSETERLKRVHFRHIPKSPESQK